MDEYKKGIILNSIINQLTERAKDRFTDEPQKKCLIDIREIIREMENKTKNS